MLEAYVGRLLRGFVAAENLVSEAEIRKTYPAKFGKAPDWIIIDGKTAILIEVKVARIHRIVYATGNEDELRESLDAIRAGLLQIHEFRNAAIDHRTGMKRLERCKEFVPVVITLEPLYLTASTSFKDFLRADLPDAARKMPWSILSIDDLEWAQVHLSDETLDIASFFRHTLTATYSDVIKGAFRLSQRTYGHSMLYAKEEELHQRIGIHDRQATQPPFEEKAER